MPRYSVTISSTANDTRKAAAIIHELAHIFCGHIPCEDKEFMKSLKIPKRVEPDKDTAEYEAEKTVEYVSKTMGIEYDAEEYLKNYKTGKVDKAVSEAYIVDAAQRLIEIMMKCGIYPHPVEDTDTDI